MIKRINVAVGIIINPADNILLAKRPNNLHQGGKWEFPGGKIETNETTTQALTRELQEEVGITVKETRPFMIISHDYPDKQVRLDIHLVTQFEGQATGLEGQQIKWVAKTDLPKYDFPDANKSIVAKLLE